MPTMSKGEILKQDIGMNCEDISKKYFRGAIASESISDYFTSEGIQPDGRFPGSNIYKPEDVIKCIEYFDWMDILHEPVIREFRTISSKENCLELAQTIIRGTNQKHIKNYDFDDEGNLIDNCIGMYADDAWEPIENKNDEKYFYIRLACERYLYTGIIGYIWSEAPTEEQDGNTLGTFLSALEIRNTDQSFKNAVDMMFEELEENSPKHFAVLQYKKYKEIQNFFQFTQKELISDACEWLAEQYYRPLGIWGIRERRFVRWRHAGTNSWAEQEGASRGTAEDDGVLPGDEDTYENRMARKKEAEEAEEAEVAEKNDKGKE